MNTSFSLVDVDTGNVIGEYSSKDGALRDVADTVTRYGRQSGEVQNLALGADDGFFAKGDQLAALALTRFPEKRSA